MRTNNKFDKKARRSDSFRRKRANIVPYERILIACEGEKTEPKYFKKLCQRFGLNPRNVVIADKRHGLDPMSLVKYALDENTKDHDFDHVFIVFDQDKHKTYHAAIDMIIAPRKKKKPSLHPITSIPCFEIWLLLHFIYTSKPFCAACDDSNCDLVISDLKKYIPDYEKAADNIFIDDERLDFAINNAKSLETFHKTSGTDNPSTRIYQLVEHLKRLKR